MQWHYFAPKNRRLPFVISDYIPRKLPVENAAIHQNNARGITALSIAFTGEPAAMKAAVLLRRSDRTYRRRFRGDYRQR